MLINVSPLVLQVCDGETGFTMDAFTLQGSSDPILMFSSHVAQMGYDQKSHGFR